MRSPNKQGDGRSLQIAAKDTRSKSSAEKRRARRREGRGARGARPCRPSGGPAPPEGGEAPEGAGGLRARARRGRNAPITREGPRRAPRRRKRPARARRPGLPRAGPAVLSAMAGLTAGFGMGPGDPRLRGRARAGRSLRSQRRAPLRAGVLGPACAHDFACATVLDRRGEELGLLVPLA